MAELTCPGLGTGSVDMNALSEAAKKAKSQEDLDTALAKATTTSASAEEATPADAAAAGETPASV